MTYFVYNIILPYQHKVTYSYCWTYYKKNHIT